MGARRSRRIAGLAASFAALAAGLALAAPAGAQGSAVRNVDGRLEVFSVNTSGELFTIFQKEIGQGWSDFSPFPTAATSKALGQVATIQRSDGRLQIAYRGVDQRIYATHQRGYRSGWEPIERVGQEDLTFASSPVLHQNDDGRIELFAVTTAGQLMNAWQDRFDSPIGDWSALGDVPLSTDAGGAVGEPWRDGTGGLVLAASSGAGELVRFTREGVSWSEPEITSASAAGRPVGWTAYLVAPFPGSYDREWIVFRSPSGDLQERSTNLSTGVVDPVRTIGGTTVVGNPSLARNVDGRVEVFIRGSNGSLWHAYQLMYSYGLESLLDLGGPCASDPAAVSNDDRRLEVFCIGPAGDLRHDFQVSAGAGWHGSLPLGTHALVS